MSEERHGFELVSATNDARAQVSQTHETERLDFERRASEQSELELRDAFLHFKIETGVAIPLDLQQSCGDSS